MNAAVAQAALSQNSAAGSQADFLNSPAAIPLILALLAIALCIIFYRPLAKRLENPATNISASISGFKIDIYTQLNAAIDKQKVTVSNPDRHQAVKRLERIQAVFKEARILWVDDNPTWNEDERKILTDLGANIDLADSSQKGEDMLRRAVMPTVRYHAVITDMKREGDVEAGRKFAERISEEKLFGRTIIYMGTPYKGDLPPYLHGATNRPNDLLHLIADVLERER